MNSIKKLLGSKAVWGRSFMSSVWTLQIKKVKYACVRVEKIKKDRKSKKEIYWTGETSEGKWRIDMKSTGFMCYDLSLTPLDSSDKTPTIIQLKTFHKARFTYGCQPFIWKSTKDFSFEYCWFLGKTKVLRMFSGLFGFKRVEVLDKKITLEDLSKLVIVSQFLHINICYTSDDPDIFDLLDVLT